MGSYNNNMTYCDILCHIHDVMTYCVSGPLLSVAVLIIGFQAWPLSRLLGCSIRLRLSTKSTKIDLAIGLPRRGYAMLYRIAMEKFGQDRLYRQPAPCQGDNICEKKQ